jgi:Cu-Zn family superoxide dismutase
MRFVGSTIVLSLVGLLACDRGDVPQEEKPPVPAASQQTAPGVTQAPAAPRAEPEKKLVVAAAEFKAIDTVKLDGKARFTELADGVQINVEVEDAPPGKKGIHVHEKGDCSDIVGKSMKEHVQGDGHRHGLPTSSERHLGDLGNIEIDREGNGKLDITVKTANLRGAEDPKSFLGRAIVIHSGEDTEKDPGGPPIACAVIEKD